MLYIDTDNGLGSHRGDVDDAFAIAAVLSKRLPVLAIGSVFGNTAEKNAFANNRALVNLGPSQTLFWSGATRKRDWQNEASEKLALAPKVSQILALGPLTNLAGALLKNAKAFSHTREVIVVGSNFTSMGPLPPLWPFEFNLTLDRVSTKIVFDSTLPLTLIPLDQAYRLQINRVQVDALESRFGIYLAKNSRRWFDRASRLKFKKTIPIWDLVAAMYLIYPELFRVSETVGRLSPLGKIQFGQGSRRLRVITDFSTDQVWDAFRALISSDASSEKN